MFTIFHFVMEVELPIELSCVWCHLQVLLALERIEQDEELTHEVQFNLICYKIDNPYFVINFSYLSSAISCTGNQFVPQWPQPLRPTPTDETRYR